MLDLIATRRALHQIPELGMEEFKTYAFLMETAEGLLHTLFPSSHVGDGYLGLSDRICSSKNDWLADGY
jgi:metal-dependent amidase/aminoacylase/carboxypeptidase family protein